MIYQSINNETIARTAGQSAVLGYPVEACSCCSGVKQVANAIMLTRPNNYYISADVTFAPTGTAATVQLLVNGDVVDEVTETVTAGNYASLHLQYVTEGACCKASRPRITLVYPNAGTQSRVNLVAKRC